MHALVNFLTELIYCKYPLSPGKKHLATVWTIYLSTWSTSCLRPHKSTAHYRRTRLWPRAATVYRKRAKCINLGSILRKHDEIKIKGQRPQTAKKYFSWRWRESDENFNATVAWQWRKLVEKNYKVWIIANTISK